MSKRSIPRICEQCGKDFLAAKCEVAKGWGRFCCRDCKNIGLSDPTKSTPEWRARNRKKMDEASKKWRASLSEEKRREMNHRAYKSQNGHRKPMAVIQAERAAKKNRTEKACTKCGQVKTMDLFRKSKVSADGRTFNCTECIEKRRRISRQKNRAKEREAGRKRYWANPEKARSQSNRCRPTPEKAREDYRKQYKKNPEKFIGAVNRRRMLKLSIPGSHTTKQWFDLCKKFDYRCVCCGEKRPLTRDHIVPITKSGSTDFIENIQPTCKPCNSRKGNLNSIDYRKTPFTGKGQAILFG